MVKQLITRIESAEQIGQIGGVKLAVANVNIRNGELPINLIAEVITPLYAHLCSSEVSDKDTNNTLEITFSDDLKKVLKVESEQGFWELSDIREKLNRAITTGLVEKDNDIDIQVEDKDCPCPVCKPIGSPERFLELTSMQLTAYFHRIDHKVAALRGVVGSTLANGVSMFTATNVMSDDQELIQAIISDYTKANTPDHRINALINDLTKNNCAMNAWYETQMEDVEEYLELINSTIILSAEMYLHDPKTFWALHITLGKRASEEGLRMHGLSLFSTICRTLLHYGIMEHDQKSLTPAEVPTSPATIEHLGETITNMVYLKDYVPAIKANC